MESGRRNICPLLCVSQRITWFISQRYQHEQSSSTSSKELNIYRLDARWMQIWTVLFLNGLRLPQTEALWALRLLVWFRSHISLRVNIEVLLSTEEGGGKLMRGFGEEPKNPREWRQRPVFKECEGKTEQASETDPGPGRGEFRRALCYCGDGGGAYQEREESKVGGVWLVPLTTEDGLREKGRTMAGDIRGLRAVRGGGWGSQIWCAEEAEWVVWTGGRAAAFPCENRIQVFTAGQELVQEPP